jgi:hypothetical protein
MTQITHDGVVYTLRADADWRHEAVAATATAVAARAVGTKTNPRDTVGLVRSALGPEQYAAFRARKPSTGEFDTLATQILTLALPRSARRRATRAQAKGGRR